MMRALIKEGGTVVVKDVPRPCLQRPGDVLIRVVVAGICRTDVYVAEGRIPCRDPIILGHEFSGVVEEAGPAVEKVRPGDRVTVMPWVACGECRECRAGAAGRCLHSQMLGVDRDGAFAEFIVVPVETVYPIPDSVSFKAGAYVEPIAASLATLRGGFLRGERGLIYGDNRIALLTQRILAAHGHQDITIYDPGSGLPCPDCTRSEEPENLTALPNLLSHPQDPLTASATSASGAQPYTLHPDRHSVGYERRSHFEKRPGELGEAEYDFAIETVATTESLADIVRAVRPRGKVVLKSRPYAPVGLDVRAAVLKELTFHAVNYGSFQAAISLIERQTIALDDLLGPVYPLDKFRSVFAGQASNESEKSFFALSDEADAPAGTHSPESPCVE